MLNDVLSIGESYLFPGDGSSHTPGKKTENLVITIYFI